MSPETAARALLTAHERYGSPKADPASIEIPISTPEAIKAQKINRLRKLFPEMGACYYCGSKEPLSGQHVVPAVTERRRIDAGRPRPSSVVRPGAYETIVVEAEKTFNVCARCEPGVKFGQDHGYPVALVMAGLAIGETPSNALAVAALGNSNLFWQISGLPSEFDRPLVADLVPWGALAGPDDQAQSAFAHVDVAAIKAATKRVLNHGKGRRPYPVAGEGCYLCGVRTLAPKSSFTGGRIPTEWHQIGAPGGTAYVCGDDFNEGCAPLVAAFGIQGGRDAALQDHIGIADATWSDLGLPRRLPVSETPFGSIDAASIEALRGVVSARTAAERLPKLEVSR